MYRIGIDVGGTNTDAVILDEKLNVIHSVKTATTKDVQGGIYNSLVQIIKESNVDKSKIKVAMLGSTHCTNALVERKNLNKVGVIRIGKPATTLIPTFIDWPQELRDEIQYKSILIDGGYEIDGRLLNELNKEEVISFCKEIKGKVEAVSISGVFSPINKDQEEQVKQWVKEELGDIFVSISSDIGSIGILERENAAILNSALVNVGKSVCIGFDKALKDLGIDAKIYFSQNDGTLMNLEHTLNYPIFTIGCGITNSIRGASFLSKVENAIVLDVGGTTTDIGVIANNFPRQSTTPSSIGGVFTNFRMPDMISIGIGGGTIVINEDNNIKIGPKSVGYEITKKALIFGGDTTTLSDIATKVNNAFEDKINNIENLDYDYCQNVFEKMTKMLEYSIDKMKTSKEDVDVILTGGGSIVVPSKLEGVKKIHTPPHYKSANAVGAALGQISGEVENIYSLELISRENAILDATNKAREKAVEAGANTDTITVLSIDEVGLSYLPGRKTKIKIKVIGELI